MRKIFIISHASPLSGPIDYLETYLLEQKIYSVNKLAHPLDDYKKRSTIFYVNGHEYEHIDRANVGILNLLIDFKQTIVYLRKYKPDTIIAANNFDCYCAVFYRKMFKGSLSRIVYFASDFSEDRYTSSLMNRIYFFIEKVALKNSDQVISNTERAEGRRLALGLSPEKSTVIPNGVKLSTESFPEKNIIKNRFVYVGSITKEHGLYELIDAIKEDIGALTIIGVGDDLDRVLELCKHNNIDLQLHKNKSHEFVMSFLSSFSGIGLAPYNLNSKWTYYCSPLKVNEYIASGLPVITSDIPEIAEEISNQHLGVVYHKLNANDILQELNSLNVKDFYKRAKQFYSHYSNEELYKKISLDLHVMERIN